MNDNWLALLAVILGKNITPGQALVRFGLMEKKHDMPKIFYQMVTNDVYELPLCEPMKAKALAEKLGIKEETVRYYSTTKYQRKLAERTRENAKKRKDYKIVGVYLDEDDDE